MFCKLVEKLMCRSQSTAAWSHETVAGATLCEILKGCCVPAAADVACKQLAQAAAALVATLYAGNSTCGNSSSSPQPPLQQQLLLALAWERMTTLFVAIGLTLRDVSPQLVAGL
jgi:hypothetical protein